MHRERYLEQRFALAKQGISAGAVRQYTDSICTLSKAIWDRQAEGNRGRADALHSRVSTIIFDEQSIKTASYLEELHRFLRLMPETTEFIFLGSHF
jgi:hypothetical protein